MVGGPCLETVSSHNCIRRGGCAKQHLEDTAAVYGGGLEWMVAYGVSLRTEYLRYDMSDNVSLSPGLTGVDAGDFIKFRDIDVVRAAVNVRLAP